LWAVDGEGDQRGSERNGEQRDQIPTHRDPPPQTAPGKINNAVAAGERPGDHEGADTDAERPFQDSVQWQGERQDLGIDDRRNLHGQEVGAETDHHERQHRTSGDDAQQCRHQSILS